MERITKVAKKAIITTLGVTLLVVGIILLVLPGPGILVIILGLIVLSWEYEWAKHHLQKAQDIRKKAVAKAKAKRNKN